MVQLVMLLPIQQVVMFAAERVRQCVRHVVEIVMENVVRPVLECRRHLAVLVWGVVIMVVLAVVEVLVRAVVIQAVAEFV